MSEIIRVTWEDVYAAADRIAETWAGAKLRYVYGIPNGGFVPAVLVGERLGLPMMEETAFPNVSRERVLVVDDLVDSGKTLDCFHGPEAPCDALFRKPHSPHYLAPRAISWDGWLEFPWERGRRELPAEDAVKRILQAIDPLPEREGLTDTPRRVVKSWEELFCGYRTEIAPLFRTFESDGYDELVLLRDIELYSTCEHHLLPFYGKAHVAYIPKGRVIGISKLARLVEAFARRLQIQERIGEQVTVELMTQLNAAGAACVIEARHLCMCARGVGKQNSVMVTSSLKGVFRDDPRARAELMGLLKG
jgi:GTP cyclohydrolase I